MHHLALAVVPSVVLGQHHTGATCVEDTAMVDRMMAIYYHNSSLDIGNRDTEAPLCHSLFTAVDYVNQ